MYQELAIRLPDEMLTMSDVAEMKHVAKLYRNINFRLLVIEKKIARGDFYGATWMNPQIGIKVKKCIKFI